MDKGNRELTVAATAVLRVEPDSATVSLAVVQSEAEAKIAYRKAHEAMANVRKFIAGFERVELRSSSVFLAQLAQPQPHQGVVKLPAAIYSARINLILLVKDLSAMERLIVGVIDAGANQLVSSEYTSSHFKQTRDRVRQMALSAAREKAAVLAEGAGVKLGQILRLTEIHFDPNMQSRGHGSVQPQVDTEDQAEAISPGSIVVGAGMNVVYQLI